MGHLRAAFLCLRHQLYGPAHPWTAQAGPDETIGMDRKRLRHYRDMFSGLVRRRTNRFRTDHEPVRNQGDLCILDYVLEPSCHGAFADANSVRIWNGARRAWAG